MIDKMAKKPMAPKMSEQDVAAKMDVLMEMLEMIQQEMGGRVKSGMDELNAPAPMVAEGDKAAILEQLAAVDPVVEGSGEEAAAVVEEVPSEEPVVEVEEPAMEDEDDMGLFGKKKPKKQNSMFED